ncbi:MAG: sugar isomerase domain-containing protein [Erysipelotrichaceae bacterium]|nr:sugar isomerase domain-containing protein [Erysipelotrichaceae bacterium]
MEAWERYFEKELEIVEEVRRTQADKIREGAKLIADCYEQGGIVRLFGCGHSHLITEDVFWRAATLGNVHAILEPSVSGMSEITKAGNVESLEGYGQMIVEYHKIAKPDIMICISNSGNKAVAIDVARTCQEKGIPTIVLTNVKYSEYLNAKHSSGKKLKDFGDVVISNCSAIGDSAMTIDGFDIPVGSTSSIPFLFIQNSMFAEAVELLVQRGIKPEVYLNGSLKANDPERVNTNNGNIVDKYHSRIRNL